MREAPFLSVVVGSRNDDHGGGLLHRMQVFIESLRAGCDHYGVDAELVLVEWNPPPDRPRLREALHWPPSSRCAVRIIEVPPALHARFAPDSALPLHQMIAKNAGIRRARGEYVVATNIDIVFSERVWETLARRAVRSDGFHLVTRADVSADVPEGRPLGEQLRFCRDHVLHTHVSRPMWQVIAGAALSPLGILPPLRLATRRARRALALARRFGRLHTNTCGDFTLMHRDAWHALGGYWEYTGFPMHVDGLICYAAKFRGLTEQRWPFPARVYHLDHDQGTGFRYYDDDAHWERLTRRGLERLSWDAFYARVEQLEREGSLPSPTQHVWGLAEESLAEHTP